MSNKQEEISKDPQLSRSKKGTEEKLLDEGWNMDKEDDQARAKEAG